MKKGPHLGLLRKGRHGVAFVVFVGGWMGRGRGANTAGVSAWGGLGGYPGAVELQEVVGGCDQPPLCLAGG
jgi:hypothetical protein